jgi:hypothetical protein
MDVEPITQKAIRMRDLLRTVLNVARLFPSTQQLLLLSLIGFSSALFAQDAPSVGLPPWKGYAIVGNGRLSAVYSDDARISAATGKQGIQHFYVDNYTVDYIASTSFTLDGAENDARVDSIVLEDPYTALSRRAIPAGGIREVRCFAHPDDAIILQFTTSGVNQKSSYRCRIDLRQRLVTDRVTSLSSLTTGTGYAIALWSNKVVLMITPKSADSKIEVQDSIVYVYGRVIDRAPIEIIITAPATVKTGRAKAALLKSERDLHGRASGFWESWMQRGNIPAFKGGREENARYLNSFKRNLYAVKSACIRGQIPADITGQFVTNNMPQLYPRDAMMCARVFLLTGHFEEAKSVIEFWARPDIPKKSKGEFYARYDANAKAVDAGSGARFDEPEWDANGYFIQLLHQYYAAKNAWLADKSIVYDLADFLVDHIDQRGLLYEGGIVEWTGYLPATNMTCAAALKTAAEMALSFGDKDRSGTYANASATITTALPKMFDREKETYASVRFHGVKAEGNYSLSSRIQDTLYLWDTSLNFGVLWGYPDHPAVVASNKFFQNNTVVLGGGMQYFDATDNAWLAAYGHDAFFFTTAAAAQYHARWGDAGTAKSHIDWMMKYANVYGLMPERIFLNQTDCSPATPLSWCCAEYAAALLAWGER